ncbi:hypothetical protein HH214_03440 [Mucilaginibacter robiniae]|uniref:IPT/TIG domain-containing protein n=1 Tax=Mucilaginibacter robiniae TaxID=2728022 RepID=A0A7L5DY87_9SPHI|nr:IPT/TIG domain-containing protein [Mucilaginibacter robiniae]QJD94999.1 hypothetical protein HH214_03440 [Mucilaginibacter robiniae]
MPNLALNKKITLALIYLTIVLILGCKKNDRQSDEQPKAIPVISNFEYNNGKYFHSGSLIADTVGKPNTFIFVNGHNFSQNFKDSKVLFNDVVAQALAGDSTYIMIAVPDQANWGPNTITIVTNDQKVVYSKKLVVVPPDPTIISLMTEGGMRNAKIGIHGSDFSPTLTKTTVTINGIPAALDSVSLTDIYLTIPPNASTGKLVVTTHGKTLTYKNDFTIIPQTFAVIGKIPSMENLVVDASDNIFGTQYNKLTKIAPNGTYSAIASIGTDPVSVYNRSNTWFTGCVMDAGGNFYLSSPFDAEGRYIISQYSNKIYKVTPEGTVSVFAGDTKGFADGQGINALFQRPMGLEIDITTGTLYVNDAGTALRKITPSGLVSTLTGVKIGPDQSYYIADEMASNPITGDVYYINSRSGVITKITPSGVITSFDMPVLPGASSKALNPNSYIMSVITAADASGAIYISVGYGVYSTIYKIKDGVISNSYLNPSRQYITGMTIDKNGYMILSTQITGGSVYYLDSDAVYKVKL